MPQQQAALSFQRFFLELPQSSRASPLRPGMSFSAEERERTALRFDVGDRVECDIGQWVAGTVHKCWCECPTARKCAIVRLSVL